MLSWVLSAAIGFALPACNYFKVDRYDHLDEKNKELAIQDQFEHQKYFILHTGGTQYHLFDIRIDSAGRMMNGAVERVDVGRGYYNPGNTDDPKPGGRYKKSSPQAKILDEVHVVANRLGQPEDGRLNIPLADIMRIDIVEHDSGRTTASYVFGTLGIAAGVFAILVVIVALTKSSCPFVYVENGGHFDFRGELFGGAMLRPLERDDYMYLRSLEHLQKTLKIRISNELKERQYTNLAELILAERGPEERTVIDASGKVHFLRDPVPPVRAVLNGREDYTGVLAEADSSSCLFNAPGEPAGINELAMTFVGRPGCRKVNLILGAKNTLWGDYVFGEFTKLFGSYYPAWIERQRQAEPGSLRAWSERQQVPLSVYVKVNNAWKLMDRIQTPGPLASRTFCVPLELAGGENRIEVKLTTGFMFWEVDFAAMDFPGDAEPRTRTVRPDHAVSESGHDELRTLTGSDNEYLFQPGPGYMTEISYSLPEPAAGKTFDVYMHARGFYEHIRNYEGAPRIRQLAEFLEPASLSALSLNLYREQDLRLATAAVDDKRLSRENSLQR